MKTVAPRAVKLPIALLTYVLCITWGKREKTCEKFVDQLVKSPPGAVERVLGVWGIR
jgi:hypothetical protein